MSSTAATPAAAARVLADFALIPAKDACHLVDDLKAGIQGILKLHAKDASASAPQCNAVAKTTGNRCLRKGTHNGYCFQHIKSNFGAQDEEYHNIHRAEWTKLLRTLARKYHSLPTSASPSDSDSEHTDAREERTTSKREERKRPAPAPKRRPTIVVEESDHDHDEVEMEEEEEKANPHSAAAQIAALMSRVPPKRRASPPESPRLPSPPRSHRSTSRSASRDGHIASRARDEERKQPASPTPSHHSTATTSTAATATKGRTCGDNGGKRADGAACGQRVSGGARCRFHK